MRTKMNGVNAYLAGGLDAFDETEEDDDPGEDEAESQLPADFT